MKRIVLAVVSLAILLVFCGCSSVEVANMESGTARFTYEDQKIEVPLSTADFKIVVDLFNGKKLYFDDPSCSFSESIAVLIGDQTFCIARDECGIIYLQEENAYFNLTDEENTRLRALLNDYGFIFPCI